MSKPLAIAIHLILAMLILAPLHYYTVNSDKRDERFAWRMFSPIRSETCATQFFVDGTPIKASKKFHNAWVGIAARGRKQVVRAMAQHLCDAPGDAEITVRILCEKKPKVSANHRALLFDKNRSQSDEDIELVASGVFNFCDTGAL